MTQYLAEDFRKLVDKLNEYMVNLEEANPEKEEGDNNTDTTASSGSSDSAKSADAKTDAEKPEDTEDTDIDHMLTTPAGPEKLVGGLNVNALIDMLKMPEDQQGHFRSAINVLKSDDPHPNREQAFALATAFTKMLSLGSSEKDRFGMMIKPVSNVNEYVAEDYNKAFDDFVGMKTVHEYLNKAGKLGPKTNAIAAQVARTVIEGGKGRSLDEGLEGVFNAVVYTVKIGMEGDRADLLHMLDDFELKYEGDNYSFDPDLFPKLVMELRKLGREILQAVSQRSDR